MTVKNQVYLPTRIYLPLTFLPLSGVQCDEHVVFSLFITFKPAETQKDGQVVMFFKCERI